MIKVFRTLSLFVIPAVLSGCLPDPAPSSNGIGTTTTINAASANTNYPYLVATPRITYKRNTWDATRYDLTVELDAAGPNPIFSVNLWVKSKSDSSVFDNLDLHYVGGTTWSATTNTYLPLPAGSYYLDSIMIEDGDSFAGGLVRSGWYTINSMLSSTYYSVDQRLTDWSTPNILEYNVGVSNIPVINFSLP